MLKQKRKKLSNRLLSLGLILASFICIIFIGALLLCCPFSQKGDGLTFIDALFTATSAVCVTGLSPVSDISSCLSLFGRIVLAVLIEIGGLGFVSIVMFIAIILGFKITFGQRLLLKEALNQDTMGGIVTLLKRIVRTAAIIQLFGTLLNFIDFFFIHRYSFMPALGYAIFHAISSFNNAGFDLFGSTSLSAFSNDILLNLSTSLMIIAGGIGFVVIFDIMQKKRIRKLSLHSKIVLSMTSALLIIGTLLFKFLNWNSVSWMEAFFLSVSTRTAGFYTFNLSQNLSDASLMIAMFFMFIGVGPVSTGGGIKVTALFVMIFSFKTFATGEAESHAFRRKISENVITKAFILSSFAFAFILMISVIVSIIEQSSGFRFEEVIFEVFSAFSTTGLSLGITPALHWSSKVILCITMFVGRLGPITFISMFNRNANSIDKDSIRYVEENIIIG